MRIIDKVYESIGSRYLSPRPKFVFTYALRLWLHRADRYRQQNQPERDLIVGCRLFLQIKNAEYGENREGNGLLQSFELRSGEHAVPHSIRRHLQAVLKKCDEPRDPDYDPKRLALEFQMPVPGERHEYIASQ